MALAAAVLAAILTIVVPALLPVAARADACLPLGGKVVLVGTLTRRTFPGPPNYRSVQQGDRPETAWVMELDNPVCVANQQGLASFQLMVLPLMQAQGAGLLGRRAWVTGTLFTAVNQHQHTPVLMQVMGIGGG